MARKERPSGTQDPDDLEEVGDWSGADEDTTAQFWSGASLARSDPKLRQAIERLSMQVGSSPAPPDPDEPTEKGTVTSLGSFDEVTAAVELPPELEPTVKGSDDDDVEHTVGRVPAEALDPHATPIGVDRLDEVEFTDPFAGGVPELEVTPPAAMDRQASGTDEVGVGGHLGPVEEFTLSLSKDLVAAAMAPAAEEPEHTEEAPRSDAGLGGPTRADPSSSRPPSPATMALMFDEEADASSAAAPNVRDFDVDDGDDPPSGAVPSLEGPPPDGSVAPQDPSVPVGNPATGPGRRVAARRRAPKMSQLQAKPPLRPPPAQPAPPPPAPPRPAKQRTRPPGGAAPPRPKGSLEELLSLADAPPVNEDTISNSLEMMSATQADEEQTIGGSLERVDDPLLSLADAPPEGEETIGAALERLDPLLSSADAPPVGERTLSDEMQLVEEDSLSDSLEPLRAVPMPRDMLEPTGQVQGAPITPSPAAPPPARSAPPRPSSTPRERTPTPVRDPGPPPLDAGLRPPPAAHDDDEVDLHTRDLTPAELGAPTAPLPQELVDAALGRSAPEPAPRPAPVPQAAPKPAPKAAPAPKLPPPTVTRAPRKPKGTVSERMRRETYTPAPAPVARKGGSGSPKLATADDLGPDGDPYREPMLAWVATLFGAMFIGGVLIALMILLIYLF